MNDLATCIAALCYRAQYPDNDTPGRNDFVTLRQDWADNYSTFLDAALHTNGIIDSPTNRMFLCALADMSREMTYSDKLDAACSYFKAVSSIPLAATSAEDA